MKKMLSILFIPFFCFAQDTITTMEGEKIVCRILEVGNSAMRYKPVKGADKVLNLGGVSSYFTNGERKFIAPPYYYDPETSRLSFTAVLNFEGVAANSLYALAKDWLAEQGMPLKVDNPEFKKVIGNKKERFSYEPKLMVNVHYSYDIKMTARDGKLKVELSNINYWNYSADGQRMVRLESCDREGGIESLIKCKDAQYPVGKLYNQIYQSSQDAFEKLDKYIKKSTSPGGGW
jgi:hypothetical protein